MIQVSNAMPEVNQHGLRRHTALLYNGRRCY